MFFWLTFGLFVGFTAVNVLGQRKKNALQGRIQKNKLPNNSITLNNIFPGDRVLFQRDDFGVSEIIKAGDGARQISIAFFEDGPGRALIHFAEQREVRLFSLAEIEPLQRQTASTTERFEKDGVVFLFELETRMRRTDGNGTLLLTAYESENHAKFLWHLETSDKGWMIQGETMIDDEINILPNR